jgi:uncharacterized cupredoxin-like copper-binding protein
MSRVWPRLLIAALFLLVFAAVALPALADGSAAAPARLMVEAREFNLVLSRGVLRKGPAIVELVVRGEDGHDLHVLRRGGGPVRSIPETRPGETAHWRGSLKPGRYRLFCSLAGHEQAGMRATLRVR